MKMLLVILLALTACSDDPKVFSAFFSCDCAQPDAGQLMKFSDDFCSTHGQAEADCASFAELASSPDAGSCQPVLSTCKCSISSEIDCGEKE